MKALIFDKSKYAWETSKGFELVNIPEPVLGVGDEENIIMKVHYAGVCGTDKGIWNRMAFKEQILSSIDAENNTTPSAVAATPPLQEGNTAAPRLSKDDLRSSPPIIGGVPAVGGGGGKTYRQLGHEFFGEVIKIGSRVKGIAVGDFVACESHVVCNKCYQCLHNQKNVCTNEKILGITVDGGFAEYAKVPAQVAWKTDTGKIRPEVAAMQEPFGNAVHAASKVNLKGKTVAIFGLGPIGMFLTIIVKGLGASSIIGIEPNPVAEDMAKKLGIDYVIPLETRDKRQETSKPYAHNEAVIEEIKKVTGGLGVDVAFEMAGFNDSVNNSIASVRRGGDVILFGLKNGDFVFEDFNKLVMKGITMHCVAGRQIWETWETTRKLMEDHSNGVQEKLFNVILDRGHGTILPIQEYTKERFEEMMQKHPKFLLQF